MWLPARLRMRWKPRSRLLTRYIHILNSFYIFGFQVYDVVGRGEGVLENSVATKGCRLGAFVLPIYFCSLSYRIQFLYPDFVLSFMNKLSICICKCYYIDFGTVVDVVRQVLQLQNYDTDCCNKSGTNVLTTTMNGITQRDTKIFTWFGENKFPYIHG